MIDLSVSCRRVLQTGLGAAARAGLAANTLTEAGAAQVFTASPYPQADAIGAHGANPTVLPSRK